LQLLDRTSGDAADDERFGCALRQLVRQLYRRLPRHLHSELETDESRLKGTIKLSTEPAKLNVTGTVRSSTIRFGTVGSAAITYSGSVSGTSMSGKYTTPGGGGSWKAHLVRRA
jgi:hypothetical protein